MNMFKKFPAFFFVWLLIIINFHNKNDIPRQRKIKVMDDKKNKKTTLDLKYSKKGPEKVVAISFWNKISFFFILIGFQQ